MREKCECGAKLPTHLFGLKLEPFAHVCLCERRWVWNGDQTEIIQKGIEINPAARVDKQIASGEISLDEVPKC